MRQVLRGTVDFCCALLFILVLFAYLGWQIVLAWNDDWKAA